MPHYSRSLIVPIAAQHFKGLIVDVVEARGWGVDAVADAAVTVRVISRGRRLSGRIAIEFSPDGDATAVELKGQNGGIGPLRGNELHGWVDGLADTLLAEAPAVAARLSG